MKRLILALSLAATALSGCAELKNAFTETQASGGQTVEDNRPYPKSSSDLGLF
jgi:outer membrane lipoprotein SlyB